MAWIAALISAGVGLYSANQQKKVGQKVGAQQDRLYGIQADTAEALQPFARQFYQSASDAYNPALAYYQALASGDRSKILTALSPQLSSIGRKYQSIRDAQYALQPRGGGSAAFNTELAYRSGDEQQALINAEQSGAYGNLAKLAGLGADIGAGAAGISTNAAAGASGMLSNAWLMQMMNKGQSAEAYGEVGKALAGLVGYDKSKGWYIGGQPGKG